MKNHEEVNRFFEKKVEEFIKNLNGRFKEHVSDDFLKALLIWRLQEAYQKNSFDILQNIAYAAASPIFEDIIEKKCDGIWNGHHTAQEFCNLFPAERIDV